LAKKNEALIDSIKAGPYPYSLPMWGAKAAAKGYRLPYSAVTSKRKIAHFENINLIIKINS
jgi:hypothetical protein